MSKSNNFQNKYNNIVIGPNSNHFNYSFSSYNDSENKKKLASASLSYYFDFQQNNGNALKLNLFENFPYKFENTEKIKLFNDKEEDKIIFETAKIIDIKSENENEEKSQNYFGPQRSKNIIIILR